MGNIDYNMWVDIFLQFIYSYYWHNVSQKPAYYVPEFTGIHRHRCAGHTEAMLVDDWHCVLEKLDDRP